MEQKKISDKEKALLAARKREQEKEEILLKADQNRQEKFSFYEEDGSLEVKNEIADMLLDEIDDPEKKYELYYRAIDRILRKHLPKGESFKQGRQWIYEEKNTFLTGKRKNKDGIRHADSRQAYSTVMAELVSIISNWIAEQGTPIQLYVTLRDENIKKGYGSPSQES